VVRFAFTGQQRRRGDPDDTVHDVADSRWLGSDRRQISRFKVLHGAL
jgi:hypothetical protein